MNYASIFLPLLVVLSAPFHSVTNTINAQESAAESNEKPNIVLFFVDDMGWGDLSYRNEKFESPNIDQLADDSLDFQQAYIACPTCSPSRATLLTGKHRATLLTGKHPAKLEMVRHIPTGPKHPDFDKFGRTETEYNLWKTDPAQVPCRNWLPLEHTTHAEALKEQGYYNLFVGKWHLGHDTYHPIHQGFDKQIGTTNWGHPKSYHPPYFRNSDVFEGEKTRYLTDKLTDEAVDFIDGYDGKKPFMISMWYYSVHGPHDGRKDLVEHFKKQGLTGRLAHYAAMVKSVDESVGRVRQSLAKKGLAKNTVIMFLSDQGGYFDNPPYRGGKRVDTLCEGGARVPMMINWPGVTKPGTTNNSVVQSTDIFPTLVELAGGDVAQHKSLDGVSLLQTIKDNGKLERGEPIFGYRAYEDMYGSTREGDWKLLTYRSGKTELYNVVKDIGEQSDVSEANQQKTKELLEKFIAWENKMGVAKYSGVQ
jgi:arylsulfatase A-like enzyme